MLIGGFWCLIIAIFALFIFHPIWVICRFLWDFKFDWRGLIFIPYSTGDYDGNKKYKNFFHMVYTQLFNSI